MLAIELKTKKKLIGELMFKFTNVGSQIGEIGYRLNTSYQSQGYAIEANTAFIEYIFPSSKSANAAVVPILEL